MAILAQMDYEIKWKLAMRATDGVNRTDQTDQTDRMIVPGCCDSSERLPQGSAALDWAH